VAESSGVTSGLSQEENRAERHRLVNGRDPLANTREKPSGCGWLHQNPKSPENTPKNAKNQKTTENQMNNKTEI